MLAGAMATVVAIRWIPSRRVPRTADLRVGAAMLIAGPSTNGSRFGLWEAGGAAPVTSSFT